VSEAIWEFCNSPVGAMLVAAILGALLRKLFTLQPAWQRIYDRWRPYLVDAVRYAEGLVGPEDPSKSASKATVALDRMLRLADLAKEDPAAIKQALSKVVEDKQKDAQNG